MAEGKKDYVIEISGFPSTTWLSLASDEDDAGELPHTSDPGVALRFTSFNEARAECRHAAKQFAPYAFRVGVLEPVEEE